MIARIGLRRSRSVTIDVARSAGFATVPVEIATSAKRNNRAGLAPPRRCSAFMNGLFASPPILPRAEDPTFVGVSGGSIDLVPVTTGESTMFTKTTKALVAGLVLTGVSLSLVANASAAPRNGTQYDDQSYMDRASNGGHHTGDTNGF
jgi:hypothetical protein